jgi:N-acetylneuraminic acid mutarotase
MNIHVKLYKAQRLKILVCILILLFARQLVSGTWTTKAPMPTARANPAGAAVNDSIYVIGGSNSGVYYPVNEVYDPLSDTWTTKVQMPVNHSFCRAVALNGKIYVVGIVNYSGPAFLQEYDPATDTWTAKTPMNIVRHSYAVGSANGKIYVIGGETSPSNIYIADNEEYDPNTDTWAAKAPMLTARARHAIGVWHDTLFCVGGNDSDSTYSKNEAYDPVTNSWTIKANMITARYGLAAARIEDTIYFLGGAFTMDRELNEAYVPTTDSWFSDALMPTGRGYFAAVSALGKIYAIGGLQGFDYLDVNEEFTATTGAKESQIHKFKSTAAVLKISPNPFEQMTDIRYQITDTNVRSTLNVQHSTISLKIYDSSGRLVKVFSKLSSAIGHPLSVTWFGKDNSGHQVPAGVYFVRLELTEKSITKKIIRLK